MAFLATEAMVGGGTSIFLLFGVGGHIMTYLNIISYKSYSLFIFKKISNNESLKIQLRIVIRRKKKKSVEKCCSNRIESQKSLQIWPFMKSLFIATSSFMPKVSHYPDEIWKDRSFKKPLYAYSIYFYLYSMP